VTYNSKAKIKFPLTYMNEESRVAAIDRTEYLKASGGTNLCAGIFSAMEVLRTN
jgi:hypothetical protein